MTPMTVGTRRETLAQMTALAGTVALGVPPAARAQSDFPNRPLRVIVPQPPGGGFDFVARQLAERLSRRLGQSVVVENRPGSGTLVGTDAAARAAPDGYTLLMGSVSNIALNMGLYQKLSYDSLRDFEPVGLAVSYGYTLVARRDLPFASLRELLDFARKNPGKLTYASAGNGSGQHVLAAALWHLAGVEVVHVPYKGAQAVYPDLIGGRVDVFIDLSSTARTQIAAGAVKPLATSGAERSALHPEAPTFIESGVALDLESWFGYFAPAKTPVEIQDKLRRELAAVIADSELRETFTKAGGKPLSLDAGAERALVKRDVERWARLVREIGIKAD